MEKGQQNEQGAGAKVDLTQDLPVSTLVRKIEKKVKVKQNTTPDTSWS